MTIFILGLVQIFKKPWVFLLTTAMLAVGFIVSTYSFLVYDSYHYPSKMAKKTLNYSLQDVYKLDFGVKIQGIHPEDIAHVKELLNSLGNMDGVEACGGYYYFDDGNINKLYVSGSIVNLCRAYDSDGMPISLKHEGAEMQYGIAYIGCDLSKSYSVGDIYYDEYTDCNYMIVGILNDKSVWLPEDLYGGEAVSLEKSVLLDFDYAVSENGSSVSYLDICNNLFFVGHGKNIEKNIKDIVLNSGVDVVNIASLKTKFTAYEKESMNNAGENYLFPFILLFAAVMVAAITSRMSMLSNKRDYGIMLSNGFTKPELIGIALIENVLRCLAAFLISALYWRVQYYNMDKFMRILYMDVTWVMFIVLTIIFAVMSEFPVRYLLKNNSCDMVNKREF